MSKSFNPSFYRWALKLPDSEPVRLLHRLAREVFAELGGEAVLRHIGFYEAILARWQGDDERRPGDREALRCMGAIERGHAKVAALHEQAWLQARAEVFQQMGERIPLPHTPEDFDRAQSAEEAAMVRRLSSKLREVSAFADGLDLGAGPSKDPTNSPQAGSGQAAPGIDQAPAVEPGAAPAPSAAYGQPATRAKRPSNKQIKQGVRLMIEARVNRELVQKIRKAAKAGAWSLEEFMERVNRAVAA